MHQRPIVLLIQIKLIQLIMIQINFYLSHDFHVPRGIYFIQLRSEGKKNNKATRLDKSTPSFLQGRLQFELIHCSSISWLSTNPIYTLMQVPTITSQSSDHL